MRASSSHLQRCPPRHTGIHKLQRRKRANSNRRVTRPNPMMANMVACLLVAGLAVAVVSAAPLQQDSVQLSKRADEIIQYGNQQNKNRVKKNDPDMPVVSDDDAKETKESKVVALPARPIENSVQPDTPGVQAEPSGTLIGAESQMMGGDGSASAEESSSAGDDVSAESSAEASSSGATSDVTNSDEGNESGSPKVGSSESAEEDASTSEENTAETVEGKGDEVDELLSSIGQDQGGDAALAEVSSDNPETSLDLSGKTGQDKYDDYYQYLMRFDNMMRTPPYRSQLPSGYGPYYRRRRSPFRRFLGKNNVVKRARRIKRDLLDDVDPYYYYQYLLPNNYPAVVKDPRPYIDDDLYGLTDEEEADEENERERLLDFLMNIQDNEIEPEDFDVPSYLRYGSPYPDEQEEEDNYIMPSKRQLLSTLPGIKKRYFYPYSQEPETHWGAFVPEQPKRDYSDAYSRVMRLAEALADERREPSIYDLYYKFDKRK